MKQEVCKIYDNKLHLHATTMNICFVQTEDLARTASDASKAIY